MDKPNLKVTAAYFAAFAAMGISMSSLGPTLPALAENTRASLSAISIVFTARSLGSLASSVVSGQIYDRQPGNRVMALMVVSMALLTALAPLVPTLWILAVVLFLTGAVQGLLNVGANVQLVWNHARNVGPFMNGLHLFFGVGTLVAPIIIAQFITQEGGLLSTYLLLAAIIFPSAIVAFLPSPTSPVTAQARSEGKIDPLLIILISLVFGCYSGASMGFSGWIFTYVTRMGLADATNAAYLTSIFWATLTLGRLVAIPVSMRVKPQHILRADFAGALVSLLAMLLFPRSLAALILTSAGFGFTLASIYPTTMAFSGQNMVLSGRITGLFAIGSNAGAMLVPWTIGQFFETAGPPVMTTVLVIDMLLAMVVLLVLARRTTRPAPAAVLPRSNERGSDEHIA